MTKERNAHNGQAKDDDALAAALHARVEKMATETLSGDVRDFILNEAKDAKGSKPWNQRSDLEQQQIIGVATRMAETIVARVVQIVASKGQPVVQAKLNKISITGDGIKADMEIGSSDQQRHALYDAAGKFVAITLADPAGFIGEREPVAINKTQKDIFEGKSPPADNPPSENGPKEPPPAQAQA